MPLARLGNESITTRDVREQVARVAVAGGRMTEREALIDLLWQESERRRLGLSGGVAAAKSRQNVIIGHKDRVRRGEVQELRADPEALPAGVQFTTCGKRLLREAN